MGGEANPGPEPAGTVFTLTAIYQGRTYSSSLTWRGAIDVAASPILRGPAKYDGTVTGSAARWSGGWGTEFDQLGIEACRTTRGTDCVTLSGDQLQCSRSGCGSIGGVTGPLDRPNRARVGNWYTGWYLFALDAHLGNDISGLVGYSSAAAIPPWPTNATVARSKAYGPVTGPPAPHVHVLRYAQVHGIRLAVASVRCVVSCRVWLAVNRLGDQFAPGERVGWSGHATVSGSALISVTGPLPHGRVSITINVGDGPYLHGYTVVR